MAIDRGPWDALVDDDGSNLVGTVLNKDIIKTVILDPVDAALALVASEGAHPVVLVNSDVGTLNNWTPAGFGTQPTYMHWTGASAATISGLVAGVDGQMVTIKNRSPNGSVLSFVHSTASASAAQNRFLNAATSAPTPVALEGTIRFVYVASVAVWVMIGHEQGAWITPPFTATDYYGLGGATWTVSAVEVNRASYRLTSQTMQWGLVVSGMVGGAASATLARKVFGGFTLGGNCPTTGSGTSAAVAKVILGQSSPTEMQFQLGLNYPNWTAGQAEIAINGTSNVI